MTLSKKPVARDDYPLDNKQILEEYKLLIEERRFVMTRYMQGIAIYLALMGFAIKEIVSIPSFTIATLLGIFVSCLNILTYYGAVCFRSMAYHALNREAILADRLKMQRPHPLIWGYYGGIIGFTLSQIALIAIIVLRAISC